MSGRKKEHDEGQDTHGSRPWVYFMIDCFLLMTNFFIISFQFKTEETILPQKLPPGNTSPGKDPIDVTKLWVHCSHNADGTPVYEYLNQRVGLDKLGAALAAMKQSSQKVRVLVKYSDDCRWQDVVNVFDICQKVQIKDCGIVASHSEAAGRI